jgi:hypothetical protein
LLLVLLWVLWRWLLLVIRWAMLLLLELLLLELLLRIVRIAWLIKLLLGRWGSSIPTRGASRIPSHLTRRVVPLRGWLLVVLLWMLVLLLWRTIWILLDLLRSTVRGGWLLRRRSKCWR